VEVVEPEKIIEAAPVVGNLLQSKSETLYDMTYKNFKKWCMEKNVEAITENVLLVFFGEKVKTFKFSTLWAQYSMIKAFMSIYDNVNISKFSKLVAFLKRNSEGYLPKKSKLLTRENVETFLTEANNNEHLMTKVKICIGN
jgi:hypothetical protein